MRVYISGPMTGWPNLNAELFNDHEVKLLALGFTPVNPARIVIADATWVDYMRIDLTDLLSCDGVLVLAHWQASPGAVLEVHVAHALKLPVLPFEGWEKYTIKEGT